MIFFEKNKVLGVEPNRVLNILEGFKKQTSSLDSDKLHVQHDVHNIVGTPLCFSFIIKTSKT